MTKLAINIADIELQPPTAAFAPSGDAAQRYDTHMGFIGPLIGAQKPGYKITAVPAGKCDFPRHNHCVNEEMFFILEGTGELRFGDETYAVKRGVPLPAHRVEKSGRINRQHGHGLYFTGFY